jgi:pimeloyl-ACP methyl ester carboxylesterase
MWTLPGYGDHLEERTPGLREQVAAMGGPAGFEDVVASINPIPDDQPDVPPHWSVTFATDDAIDYYVRTLSNPDSLRGSFGWYRAIDATIAQDAERKNQPLTMPVMAIGGERSFGEHVGEAVRVVAPEVQSVVIPDTGHFLAEESPEELLAALTPFLSAKPVAAAA